MEHKLLELFRDCAISKDFSRLNPWIRDDKAIIFRRNKFCVERPVDKEYLMKYISDFFKYYKVIRSHGIKFMVEENCFGLFLLMGGVEYIIRIEVDNNQISTLWMTEDFKEVFPKTKYEILKAIASAWEKGDCLYIEDLLDKDFKYEMYGNEKLFGLHVLNKRQYIVWLDSRFSVMRYRDLKPQFQVVFNGLKMTLNGKSRIITMKIVDGKILEAKETDNGGKS